jgi:hypothetical protein
MAIPVAITDLPGSNTQDETVSYAASVGTGSSITREISAVNSTFTAPATKISSYQWILLEKPSSSSATILNATSETCTLSGIQHTGTYRVFLIVTDDQGNTSQSDILKAPDQSFAQVHVQTENLSLVKPASGERNWSTHYHDFVDKVDALKADVTGVTVAAATTAALGTVKLADSPLSASAPEALTVERRTLTAVIYGQAKRISGDGGGLVAGIDVTLPSGSTANHSPNGNASPALCAWVPGHGHPGDKTLEIKHFFATMINGGKAGKPSEHYEFKLFHCSKTQYLQSDVSNWTEVSLIQLYPAGGEDGEKPLSGGSQLAAAVEIPEGNHVVVTCSKAPSNLGTGLTLTVELQVRH